MQRAKTRSHSENEQKVLQGRVLYYRCTNYLDNYDTSAVHPARGGGAVADPVTLYSLAEAFRGAAMLMCQVDSVALYLGIFGQLRMGLISSHRLLMLVACCALLCLLLYTTTHSPSTSTLDGARTIATLLLFGYGFTPVIRTLTTSISTDTIYVSGVLLFALSLVFHDYGLDAPMVSASFSLNCCLAASVFLISRVDNSDQDAFHLLTLSMCAFGFWPKLRNVLSLKFRALPIILVAALCPAAVSLLVEISRSIAALLTLLHIFVLLICPMLLIWMQKRYKKSSYPL